MKAAKRPRARGRARAAIGSALFLLVAPGLVAGLGPWLVTRWDGRLTGWAWVPLQAVGVMLLGAGAAALLHSFVRFVTEGAGTPAPVAPTEQLVVGGLYRYVRNPMYLAVGALLLGQALVLGRPVLLVYLAAFAVAVGTFVRWYEEPTLARTYGEQYAVYRRAVPGWVPRLRPWDGR